MLTELSLCVTSTSTDMSHSQHKTKSRKQTTLAAGKIHRVVIISAAWISELPVQPTIYVWLHDECRRFDASALYLPTHRKGLETRERRPAYTNKVKANLWAPPVWLSEHAAGLDYSISSSIVATSFGLARQSAGHGLGMGVEKPHPLIIFFFFLPGELWRDQTRGESQRLMWGTFGFLMAERKPPGTTRWCLGFRCHVGPGEVRWVTSIVDATWHAAFANHLSRASTAGWSRTCWWKNIRHALLVIN